MSGAHGRRFRRPALQGYAVYWIRAPGAPQRNAIAPMCGHVGWVPTRFHSMGLLNSLHLRLPVLRHFPTPSPSRSVHIVHMECQKDEPLDLFPQKDEMLTTPARMQR